MKRLVVTADDFGLSPEVNAAVAEGRRNGVLTAASLMVGAPAAAEAVALAKADPDPGGPPPGALPGSGPCRPGSSRRS